MKNRASKYNNAFVIGTLILPLALLIAMSILRLITQNDPEIFRNYSFTLFCVACPTYLIFAIIINIKYYKAFSEDRKNMLEEAMQTLNSEFKPVVLINPTNISKKEFICKARLDENGKIICKINVDFETNFDNYEDFLNFFDIPEE